MTTLGFSAETGRLYERLVPASGVSLEDLARGMATSVEELRKQLDPLLEHNIARVEGDRVVVMPPAEAVGRLLGETAADAVRTHHRLLDIAAALPYLAGSPIGPLVGTRDVEPIDGEVSSGGAVPGLVEQVISQTTGDLLWLRPDQWSMPYEPRMIELLGELVGQGRRSRAIYPVHVLSDAPGVVMDRAAVGEEVRVLPELPTRMIVIGRSHAVLPEPLGYADSPRTMVRQRGLVELAALLFEELWRRAAPVAHQERADTRPDLRRFLLEQLASGAQDEQIARRLGVSLRTVRRRVAELMADLGAESRFQAGVEAVRRGWL